METSVCMAIIYDPKKLLKHIAPEAKIKRMLSRKLDLKRAALSFVDSVPFIDKKAVTKVALKTVRGYQERVAKKQVEAGFEKGAGEDLEKDLIKNPRQLIQRVQNEVLWQVKEEIKHQYRGEKYEWLPSDAEEPDPEHQLKYGEIFEIGVGEMPGDREGCKCGMRILVNETELSLE